MDLIVQYQVENCSSCGFQFALPTSFIKCRRDDHKSFYCPACKNSMYYPGLSDKEKLVQQLHNAQECCVEYEQKAVSLERSRRSYKGHVTRLKAVDQSSKVRQGRF